MLRAAMVLVVLAGAISLEVTRGGSAGWHIAGIVMFGVAGVALFLRAIHASGQSAWPSIMWGLMCVTESLALGWNMVWTIPTAVFAIAGAVLGRKHNVALQV